MNEKLTTGFLKKKYNKILIANLLGWFISTVGSLADSVIGGIYISEDAVSATGLVSPVFTILMFFSFVIGIGAANRYSIYEGAFDKENGSKVAGMSVVTSLILGVFLAALIYFGEDAFFSFYDTTDTIHTMAIEYYRPFVIMALLYPLYWSVYYLVIADGNANLVFVSDASTAVVNAVVSLGLVGKIGVKGLAYGTIASLIAGGVILIFHFFSKSCSIRFKFCLDFKLMKELAISGSSTSMTTLYIGIVDVVMNKFVIICFGSPYLAAYAIINLILNSAQLTMCATDAGGPFIGTSYGEKNSVMLKKILKMCTKNNLIISGILMVAFFAGSNYVPAVYGITTPEVMSASVYATKVLALSYIFTGLIYEWINYMPRINKNLLANILGITYSLISPIVLAILLGKAFGYNGMVWGFFFTPIVGLLVGILFVIKKYGKDKLPYVIDESSDVIFNHEFAVNIEEFSILRNIINEELKSCNVSEAIIGKLELMLEETINIIIKENEDKKRILGDCTIMVNDDYVRLITRDNGKVFDITKSYENLKSLDYYVVARMMETNTDATYLTTISFNRNTFLWKR